MTKQNEQDVSEPDAAARAVADVDLSADERDDFVIRNRYSPEREAAMRARARAVRNLPEQAPGGSQFMPQQVDSGIRDPSGDPVVHQFDVGSSTIAETEVFLDEHDDQPELVAAALEAENAADAPRKGMIEMLERRQRALGAAD